VLGSVIGIEGRLLVVAFLHLVAARPIQVQREVGIRHVLLGNGKRRRRLGPVLPEKNRSLLLGLCGRDSDRRKNEESPSTLPRPKTTLLITTLFMRKKRFE
jgi:hypothetical protein